MRAVPHTVHRIVVVIVASETYVQEGGHLINGKRIISDIRQISS